MELGGLHHVTAVTANASCNVAFYTDVLGLRMASRDRELEFGVSVVPLAGPPGFALGAARAAEEAALDLVGIQDHPYQRRGLKAKLDRGDDFALVEVLSRQHYESGNLPGEVEYSVILEFDHESN